MDACYAMYKRLFRDAYPMSYDLEDLQVLPQLPFFYDTLAPVEPGHCTA